MCSTLWWAKSTTRISLTFYTQPILSIFESPIHREDGNLISLPHTFPWDLQPNSRGPRLWVWVLVCILEGIHLTGNANVSTLSIYWNDGHLSSWPFIICPCRIRDKMMSKYPFFPVQEELSVLTVDFAISEPHLWGTGIILLSCDRLTLKRDCETIKGSICLISTSLPEGSQHGPLSCWNTGKGGQREKVNIHLKTSANISEYYPTTLLANCTNHFGKCLFLFLLTPTTFSFPKALYPLCTSKCLHANFACFSSMYYHSSFYFSLK